MIIRLILFTTILLSAKQTLAQTPGLNAQSVSTTPPVEAAQPTDQQKPLDEKLSEQKTPETPNVQPTKGDWKPKLNWSGDLRYRMAKSKEGDDDERTAQQLRVRLGLKADVNETTQAIIRLATATSAISANQTLGDSAEPGMARRPFGIDQAYIDFRFLKNQGAFWIGRTANPFWAPAKVQTLFDTDLAFEGLAIKLEPKFGFGGAFLNLGGFIISENYTAPNDNVDTGLVGGDAGVVIKNEDWSFTGHFGNYYYLNIKNRIITKVEKDAKIDAFSSNPNERFRGNTVYVNDPLALAADRKYFYAYQYILLEAGAEWKHKLQDFEYTLYIDAVNNDARRKEGHALEYGLNGKWRWLTLGYARIKKEADSMLSSFTESDTNGGGTGNKGDRIFANFAFNKNASLQITQFTARRGIDVVSRKFAMTHVDLQVSF